MGEYLWNNRAAYHFECETVLNAYVNEHMDSACYCKRSVSHYLVWHRISIFGSNA